MGSKSTGGGPSQIPKAEPSGYQDEAKKLEDSKKLRIGRSVSLSRNDQKRKEPKTPPSPPRAKKEREESPSPKRKPNLEGVSVKAKKESYEKIQEKNQIQRSMKDNNRGKLNRGKKSKPPSPEKTEDPMAKI